MLLHGATSIRLFRRQLLSGKVLIDCNMFTIALLTVDAESSAVCEPVSPPGSLSRTGPAFKW